MKQGKRIFWVVFGALFGVACVAGFVAILQRADETPRLVASGSGDATVTEVRYPRNCCQYEVSRRLRATIYDSTFPGGALWDIGPLVTPLKDGSYLVTVWDALYHATPAGKISQRVGKSGAGPGEYQLPWRAVDADSAIAVFDLGNARITRIDRRSFAVLHTARLPPFMGLDVTALLPGSGNYLISGQYAGAGLAAHQPLHVVTPEGELLRSFGERPVSESAHRRHPLTYRATVAGDTAIWIAAQDEYRFQQWDTAGTLRRVVVRNPQWFKPNVDANGRQTGPRVSAIHQDSAGYLWVMSVWPKKGPIRRCAPRCPVEDLGSETWIEVFDLEHRSVVAAWHETGPEKWPIHGTDFVYSQRFTESAEMLLDVFSYSLETRRARKGRTGRGSEP